MEPTTTQDYLQQLRDAFPAVQVTKPSACPCCEPARCPHCGRPYGQWAPPPQWFPPAPPYRYDVTCQSLN